MNNVNYTVSEANWKDLPQIKNYVEILNEELRALQKKINEWQQYVDKLDEITHWSNETPFAISIPYDKSIKIKNIKSNLRAQIYPNAQDETNTKYGVYTWDVKHKESCHGSQFTLEEAKKIAYDHVGFISEGGR